MTSAMSVAVAVAAAVAVAVAVAVTVARARRRPREGFETGAVDPRRVREVFEVYREVLGREPTEEEIRAETTATGPRASRRRLEFRLRSTDEYTRRFRMGDSADVPDPNASLVVRDAEVIQRVMLIYRFVTERQAPREIRYPLRDLWIILGASDRKLVGVLRARWWPTLEDDIVREVDRGLNREKLLAMIRAIEEKHGRPIAEYEFRGDMSGLEALLDGDDDGGVVVDDEGRLATCQLTRSGPDSVGGMTRIELEKMFEEISRRITATNEETTRKLLRRMAADGNGDAAEPGFPKHWHQQVTIDPERDLRMHARPEFAWTVPQVHQPACHDLRTDSEKSAPAPAAPAGA